MDFQLILYIIVVIVWLILDNYKRVKKKQEQVNRKYNTGQPPKETEKPYTTLEDILREFGMEEEPEIFEEQKPKPKPQPEIKPKPLAKQKNKPHSAGYETYESTVNYESSINKDYKFSSQTFTKGYSPSVSRIGDIKDSEISDESVMSENKNRIDFDLRKAVVWSEILKRPYS